MTNCLRGGIKRNGESCMKNNGCTYPKCLPIDKFIESDTNNWFNQEFGDIPFNEIYEQNNESEDYEMKEAYAIYWWETYYKFLNEENEESQE